MITYFSLVHSIRRKQLVKLVFLGTGSEISGFLHLWQSGLKEQGLQHYKEFHFVWFTRCLTLGEPLNPVSSAVKQGVGNAHRLVLRTEQDTLFCFI